MTDQKTAVIFGLANKRSIAWAIAQKLAQDGWQLAITYMNERLALDTECCMDWCTAWVSRRLTN